MRIAINGFGRIGKNFLRALFQEPSVIDAIHPVVINVGPGYVGDIALQMQYDTLMGRFREKVEKKGDVLHIGDRAIRLLAYADPHDCNWSDFDIDWVVDCSGAFTKRDKAELHLKAGARFVLISAPAEGEDVNIIPGINQDIFDQAQHKIVSLGSCTTNALIPILHVLHTHLTITRGFMTTIHAYTNSQVLLDLPGKDPRMSRAGALNIIPGSTGAAKMVGKIIPDLGPRLEAISLRVPVAKGSLIDLVLTTDEVASAQDIVQLFEKAAATHLKGILAVSKKPLVSSDYYGDSHSVIIDALLTEAKGNMVKIFGWYDNEWGYSMRLRDFLYALL